MAQRVYATVSDYDGFAEEPSELSPEALAKRLRSASSEVEGLTRLSVYEVDEDGMPVDAGIADTFKEATCAIAEHWSISDDPTGAESFAGAVKIGSVSLGTTSAGSDSVSATVKRIGQKAATILGNAGLFVDRTRY